MFTKARKIMMGATLALIVGIGMIPVQAEEENPLVAETEINITVNEGTIVGPGDGGDGGEENPGGTKGNLSIWLKPTKMNFSGSYDEIKDYTLKMDESELAHRRIAVADVRANEIHWGLNAKLTELKEVNGTKTIDSGYSMSMKPTIGKFKINEDGTVNQDPNEIIKDNVGVLAHTNDEGKIVIDLESKQIMRTDATEARPGKGYTTAQLNEIEMKFEAAKGLTGDFQGQVVWTLSNAPE